MRSGRKDCVNATFLEQLTLYLRRQVDSGSRREDCMQSSHNAQRCRESLNGALQASLHEAIFFSFCIPLFRLDRIVIVIRDVFFCPLAYSIDTPLLLCYNTTKKGGVLGEEYGGNLEDFICW